MNAAWVIALVWKSVLVLGLAALAAFLLRGRSAAVRHALWSAASLSLLALPVLSSLQFSWSPVFPKTIAAPLEPLQRISIEVTGSDGARFRVAEILLAAWGCVALLLLFRCVLQHLRAARLAGRATPWNEEGPDVRLSAETSIPMACGFLHPVVLLPEEASSWDAERLRLVLLHERLHIARHDIRIHALASVASALYWFNPVVWYALARLRAESEQACDDAVLLTGEEAPVYATHLVEIARSVRFDRPIPEGGIPMARMSQLEERLRALFNPAVNRAAVTGQVLAALFLATAITVVPLSALQPPAATRSAQPGFAGVVKDPSGAVVAGARIRVTNTESQRSEVARSGDDGSFVIAPLPEGFWTIEVAAPGFAKLRMEKVRVAGPEPTPLNLNVMVGGISESVSVVGDAPPSLAPAATGAAPRAIRVGGNIMAAKMVTKVSPKYPPECKAERIQGTVLLKAVISKTGEPLSLEPINQLVDNRLVDSAISAVRQWRWQPTLLNGAPVEVITEIEVNYTLAP